LAQGVGPEFKPQYHNKQKEKERKEREKNGNKADLRKFLLVGRD
jgi:hypothetical protein